MNEPNDRAFDLQLFADGDATSAGGDVGAGAAGAQAPAGTAAAQQPTAGGTTQPAGQATQQQAAGQPQGQPAADGKTILGQMGDTAPEYDFRAVVPQGMEYDEEQAKAFTAVASEMKLTPEQANKLAAYGMKYANGLAGLVEQQRMEERNGWADEARKELGIDFDRTLQQAGAGLEALEKAIPNLRQALDYTGAGNRIEVIRALAFVGEMTREDTFRGFGANAGTVKSSLYPNSNFGLY